MTGKYYDLIIRNATIYTMDADQVIRMATCGGAKAIGANGLSECCMRWSARKGWL